MPLIDTEPDALAKVYAQSLFELAEQEGGRSRQEELSGELDELVELTRQHPKLNEFFASRILPMNDRERSIRNIFEGRISTLLHNFLQMLNRKERLHFLLPIAAAYDVMVQERFGRVEIDIYTSREIAPDQLSRIQATLERTLHRELVVHTYVDPAMLGGIKMQVGDKLVDASVSTKLRKLRDRLSTEGLANVRSIADRIIEEKGEF